MEQSLRKNPYVGPTAFGPDDPLYGRETETRILTNLLGAERIVLLHSPSGAGKTSVIHAALIPRLRERKFYVRSVARVNRLPPQSVQNVNRYVFSALSAFEADIVGDQIPEDELATLSLGEYLARRPHPEEISFEVLIFDQFEEILSLDPTDQKAKEEFFAQLGEVLSDRNRWALFSMREDYVAALAPFRFHIPNRLDSTFRLDLLSEEAACQALKLPAKASKPSVLFEDDAVQKLVDDLRVVQVQGLDGKVTPQKGPNVEPMALQVAARKLWERLSPGQLCITTADVVALGNVGRALGDYYDQVVEEISKKTNVSERVIRNWCGENLIVEGTIRGQVPKGGHAREGITEPVVSELEAAHLIRGERRGGTIWYELSHDRFIFPILEANKAWFDKNQSPFLRDAKAWEQSDNDKSKLYEGKQLRDALEVLKEHQEELSELEIKFLEKSQDAAEDQRVKTQQRTIILLTFIIISLVGLVVFAVTQWYRAGINEASAKLQQQTAEALRGVAEANQQIAVDQMMTANAASVLADQQRQTADAARVLEGQQRQTAEAAGVLEAQQRQTAVAAGILEARQRQTAEAAQALAEEQRLLAEAQKILAQAGELSSLSGYYRDRQLDLSLLLGVEAFSRSDSWETRQALLEGIQRSVATRANLENTKLPICEDPLIVTFSPDGKMFATACWDGRIGLWYADGAGNVKDPPEGFRADEPVEALAFNSTSTVLARGSRNGIVYLWDITTGEVKDFKAFGYTYAPITELAYQPNGTLLAITTERDYTSRQGQIILYDQALGEETFRTTCGPYECISLAWSPDGSKLAVGNTLGTIIVLNASTGSEIQTFSRVHTDDVTGLAWYPDGNRLVSGGLDGYLYQWDVNSGEKLRASRRDDTPLVTGLALSPSGLALITGVTAKDGPPWVAFWNGETLERLSTSMEGHSQAVTTLAADPTGQRFATASYDNTVLLWNYEPVDPLYEILWVIEESPVMALGLDSAGQLLAARRVGEVGMQLWVQDSDSDPLYFERFGEPIHAVAIADGGKTVVIDAGGLIRWMDPETGDEKADAVQLVNGGVIDQVALSGDEQRLAIVACARPDEGCNQVVIWDRRTNEKVEVAIPIGQMPDRVMALALSEDGQLLALGGRKGEIVFYNLETQTVEKVLAGQMDGTSSNLRITVLAFSPEEMGLFAAGYSDGRIALWEAKSKNPVGEFNDWKEGSLAAMLFYQKADGFWALVTVNDQSKVVEWQVDKNIWKRRACQVAGRLLTPEEKERFLFDRQAPDPCEALR